MSLRGISNRQMRVLIVFVASLAIASAWTMDQKFCDSHKLKPSTKPKSSQPTIPKDSVDFTASSEMTNDNGDSVSHKTTYFSGTNQFIQIDLKEPGQRTFYYGYAKTDTYMKRSSSMTAGVQCTSSPFYKSVLGNEYDISVVKNKDDAVYLPPLKFMSPASIPDAPVYIGSTEIRGIAADKWQFCAFRADIRRTYSIQIYYSADTYKMPGSTGRVPLLLEAVIKDVDGTSYLERTDFSNFSPNVNKKLEIPYSVYCTNAVTANNDMKVPIVAKFESSQRNLGDPNKFVAATPRLRWSKSTYSIIDSMYSETAFEIASDKSFTERQLVHDFSTGLEYMTNLQSGSCSISPIQTDSVDYVKTKFLNLVKMKTPEQFFNIEPYNYAYLGKNKNFDRGIEADVYTSMSKDNILRTWWFASKNFLKKLGYTGDPMPLRYRQETTMEVQMSDLFGFSSALTQDDLYKDVSGCFKPSQKLFLSLELNGRYDQIYTPNPEDFKASLGTALITNAGIISMERVSGIRVDPATKDTTLVRFELLDKSSTVGNSENALPEDSLWKKIYPKLKKSLDNKKFTMTVNNYLGKHIIKLIKYSRGLNYANSVRLQMQASVSTGYSPGSMAGLGVGMLLLGLILGFGGVKGVKRHRDRVPDINMQNLGQQS